MKVCDRCRVPGCLLDYGGKACRNARKQECPDVVFTKERILNAAAKGLLFLFLYVMLDLCWIGAECVFEGIVHESRVDGVVLAWLCLLLVREIEQFERKIRGDGR